MLRAGFPQANQSQPEPFNLSHRVLYLMPNAKPQVPMPIQESELDEIDRSISSLRSDAVLFVPETETGKQREYYLGFVRCGFWRSRLNSLRSLLRYVGSMYYPYLADLTHPCHPPALPRPSPRRSARIHNEPLREGVLHSAAIMTKKDHLSKHVVAASSKASRRTNDRVMASSDSSSRRSPIHVLTAKKDM